MANICYADTGSTADATRVVQATADGVLQIAPPSNLTAALIEAGVSFDGVTAGNPKVLFEVLRYATPLTTSDTGWTAVTEVNVNGSDSETPQVVAVQAAQNGTPADASGPVVIHREWIHPQAGGVWRPSGVKIKSGTACSIRLSCASSQPHYIAWFYWME